MDRRTLREKLQAMAERGTPPEQAIARTKLAEMGAEPPKQPPAPPGAAAVPPEPFGWTYGTNSNASSTYQGWYVRVDTGTSW